MKKTFLILTLVLAVAATTPFAQAQESKAQDPNPGRVNVNGPLTKRLPSPVMTNGGRAAAPRRGPVGTITYDDGVVTAVPSMSSFSYGNQFDTQNGAPVFASGTITQGSFFMITAAGSDAVFWSVFGPVVGTAAPVITSLSVPSNGGAFNTVTGSWSYTGPSFLAGVWYIGGDTVGLGSGTAGGQGDHGMVINDLLGTGFQTLQGLNALVRTTGTIIPVELQSFSIADDS